MNSPYRKQIDRVLKKSQHKGGIDENDVALLTEAGRIWKRDGDVVQVYWDEPQYRIVEADECD